MVFLHGMFGRPADWAAVAKKLEGEWRVLVPQLPVFEFPAGRCGLETLCETVERRLDQEGMDRVVLAGNSLGGHLAILMAVRQPGRVAGLVLTGSAGMHERGFERGVPRRPTREWLRNKVEEVFYDPVHVTDELLDEVSATIGNTRTLVNVVRLARAVKRNDVRTLLPGIRCPVLLIWGTHDQITPPDVGHEFARNFPRAELHFIERCGHTPPMERPTEFLPILRAYLEKLLA